MASLGVEHADTRRAVRLVSREGVEVAIEIANIDGHVHGRLAAIDQHRNAPRMRDPDDLLDRYDGAEHVRHVRDGDHLGAWPEQALEAIEQQFAAIADRRPFEDGTAPL